MQLYREGRLQDAGILKGHRNSQRKMRGWIVGLGEIELGSRRNDWPHEIEPVNCGRHAIERSDLTGKRIHAESLRAGSHEYSCAAFLFAGEGEGELDVRSGLKLDVRVEENTAARDVAQLACVKIRRTASCQADLNREVNLVTPCFSSLSHFPLGS